LWPLDWLLLDGCWQQVLVGGHKGNHSLPRELGLEQTPGDQNCFGDWFSLKGTRSPILPKKPLWASYVLVVFVDVFVFEPHVSLFSPYFILACRK
jgi:hypothetical protein